MKLTGAPIRWLFGSAPLLVVACGNAPGDDYKLGGDQYSADAGVDAVSGSVVGMSQAPGGPCHAGETIACRTEIPRLGLCHPGTSTCTQSGTFGACADFVAPAKEVCGDGIDNDCDGLTDEDCGDGGASGTTHGVVLEGDAGTTQSHTVTSDAGTDGPPVTTTTGHSDCNIPAPRLIAPMSTSRATRMNPSLKWALPASADGARIELCRDRACSSVIQTFDAQGTHGVPTTDLPPGVVYWRAYGRSGGSTGCDASPVWEFFVNRRSAAVDASWGTVLDVNEDGYADLFVGAADGASNPSTSFLYLGGPNGLASTPSGQIDGVNPASIGDVNGDGFADVAVSVYVNGSLEHRLYLGNANGVGSTYQSFTGYGYALGSNYQPTAGGDFNGDGYSDLAFLGEDPIDANSFTITAHIHLGGPSGVSSTPAAKVQAYGSSIENAGDVNADGYGDFIVADWGSATVVLGASDMTAATITGLAPSISDTNDFGMPSAGGGDINGDGYADVLITQAINYSNEPDQSPPASVWVFLGSASGVVRTASARLIPPGYGGNTTDKGGIRTTALDADGDGFWDVAVADPLHDKLWIYMGGAAGVATTPIVEIDGSPGGRFGEAMSGADMNGDGFEDLAVGAPQAPAPGPGRVFLFPGSSTGLPTSPSITLAPATSTDFGMTLSQSASGT